MLVLTARRCESADRARRYSSCLLKGEHYWFSSPLARVTNSPLNISAILESARSQINKKGLRRSASIRVAMYHLDRSLEVMFKNKTGKLVFRVLGGRYAVSLHRDHFGPHVQAILCRC